MKRAVIIRKDSSDEGTFGILTVYAEDNTPLFTCFTGELPYRGNKTGISCIPLGSYTCQPWHSRRFPNHYNVMRVPNRVAILIHTGNFCGDRSLGYLSNVEGCILVGRSFGSIKGQKAVLSSQLAMNDLRKVIGEANFTLTIKEK